MGTTQVAINARMDCQTIEKDKAAGSTQVFQGIKLPKAGEPPHVVVSHKGGPQHGPRNTPKSPRTQIIGFWGGNTKILTVFGPENSVIWVLGRLGYCSSYYL